MRLVITRRELTEPGQLQALVIDHVDGIEPGLAVLDSRLLLGQATIDVIGLDAHDALVLMAVGSIADEEMLLKAVEAYSWCLEYPEAIRRLYPSAQISSSQPPRLVFVVERMPDSFHRKIKQLGFPEVDCVEFRYLDVDGTPAVYFETLARLRRGPVAAAPAPERVVTPAAPVTNDRPTGLKLQKLLGADRPGLVREPGKIVSLLHRTTPRPETPKPVVDAPKLESVAAPRIVDDLSTARRVSESTTPAAAVMAVVETVATPIVVPEPESLLASDATTVEPVDRLFFAPESLAAPGIAIEAVVEPAVTPEPIFEHAAVEVAPVAPPEPVAVVPDLNIPEIEPVGETATAPEPIGVDAGATELPASVEPEADEAPAITVEPEPIVATIAQPEPFGVEAEIELTIASVADPEPVLTLATTSDPEIEPRPVASMEPAVAEVAAPVIQAVEPVAAPAKSVFARRAAEPIARPAEPRVSFADAAKDLLSVTNPAPRSESPAAIQRPSDTLVGVTEKPAAAAENRVPAFAKPAGAFANPAAQKSPRTIAPPPPDPQPIAAGPKSGAAPTRVAPPAPIATPEPAPAPAAAPPAAQPAPPQGFDGLQFPNDGVLTRQWMEFLNQMAAGK